LSASVLVFTQVMPQRVSPIGQGIAPQVPAVQTWPIGQAAPQAPQLAMSVWRFTQEPPHAVCPGMVHTVVARQVPPMQV
jgi:hypothetical protein